MNRHEVWNTLIYNVIILMWRKIKIVVQKCWLCDNWQHCRDVILLWLLNAGIPERLLCSHCDAVFLFIVDCSWFLGVVGRVQCWCWVLAVGNIESEGVICGWCCWQNFRVTCIVLFAFVFYVHTFFVFIYQALI